MGNKILLIDDDVLILKTLRKLLEREKYIVESAQTAQEGIEKGGNLDFDLILCDIRIPGTDGIEIIRQIKERRNKENKPEIPVIFITGYASEDAPIGAIKLGAKDYILKPFDLDKLLQSVRDNLKG